MILLFAACVVDNVVGDKADPSTFDTGDSWAAPDDSDTVATPVDEVCDGVDNDGDGLVDEGFDDVDGDGVADCVDDDCAVNLPAPRAESDPACAATVGPPPADPWNVAIKWQWTGGSAYATPAVGDLDHDGVPEIVATVATTGSYLPGDLAIFDGASGTVEHLVTGTIDASGGVALGDLDGDGNGDIVTFDYDGGARSIAAYDKDLDLLWEVPSTAITENHPAIADLEGDGVVEVVVNDQILDGATGTVVATLAGAGSTWGANAVADLDGDGVQEILMENGVWEADGTLRFLCGTGGNGTFPQPVNADADAAGEVLVTGRTRMTLCDDDGTELWHRTYANYGTATAVADFDGDGVQEYAFANTSTVTLLEPDGTEDWAAPMNDLSGLSGTTSWDIDLDGIPEVIFGDEQDILVYDGRDGTVVYDDPAHASVTLAETPAVADVDGDGHGDLVYVSNGTTFGLTVLSGADGDWPYAPTVYNQQTYYGGNINEDLSVPRHPEPPWLYAGNLFRGQPSALALAGSPNLRVSLNDVCAAGCENGPAHVTVQVWNDGSRAVDAGISLELWSDAHGTSTLVATQVLPAVPAAGSVELTFDTTSGELGDTLWVEVDPADQLTECHEDDDRDELTGLPCP